MSGMNAGFAAYLAAKKAGKAAPAAPAAPVAKATAKAQVFPPAVFNNVPGLPVVGKRHAKVAHKTAKKKLM